MQDYSKTLNLPKTNFSMRANLREKEPKILEKWNKEKIYFQTLENKKKKFVFHDGPPYANGDIHVGTAFNKILKDIALKYKRLKGYKVEFKPGWDTHGLPIEMAVVKSGALGEDKLALRKKFREHAAKYLKKQKADFARLGILADWENPYVTMDPKFEADQLRVFAKMVENGDVYTSLKPVHWCTKTRTALAEAEVVYKNHISDSIYFKAKAGKDIETKLGVDNLYFAVWTTTPWTLPANLAIALNSELEYSIVSDGTSNLIIASNLYETLSNKFKLDKIIKTFNADEIEKLRYYHPFINREGIIVLANHVTSDAGTGCVHTAPGHGMDDYIVGKKYELDILCPVDDKGYMTPESTFEGFYADVNQKVMETLKDNLILHEKIEHSYPFSERGKVPIIFRATKQWFVDVDRIKSRSIEALQEVRFYPDTGKKRLESTVANRPDWCISRQRIWGVPIPAYYCECGKAILDSKLINEIADKVEIEGSEVLLENNITYFTDKKYCCGDIKLGRDIFDVWFDSGTTYTVMGEKVDLYLEGSDQHRGWFQSSLLTKISAYNEAPYNSIVTHGYVLDGEGLKMSKSLGNVIRPQEVIDKYGADILRLWTASVDAFNDVKISDDILQQHVENYRKIRNAFRFMLGNMSNGGQPTLLIDKLVVQRSHEMLHRLEGYYERYQFRSVISETLSFLTEISSFYFDIIKNRLYTEHKESKDRLSAQAALREILYSLAKVLSPILSFTIDEIWSYVSDSSIFLETWPEAKESNTEEWNKILKVRDEVNSRIEEAISKGLIKKSSELTLGINLNYDIEALKEMFKVSNVIKSDEIYVKPFDGVKCERCWLYFNNLKGDICQKCTKVLESY